jgi:hypothetical protein
MIEMGEATLLVRTLWTVLSLIALVVFASASAQAGYVVTLEEVGSNVVASGSGAIDLTGLTFLLNSASQTGMIPSGGAINTGQPGFVNAARYTGFTGPTNFGSGDVTLTSSGSGVIVGIDNNQNLVVVPLGYVSDSLLADTSIYDNATFASLGVTPGTYEWTWGTGADQNFTLQIEATPVPEPESLAILASALAAIGVTRRRRRSA